MNPPSPGPEPAHRPSSLLFRATKSLRLARRWLYRSRLLIPGLREQHLMEAMVGPVGAWKELQRYQLRALQANGLLPHHSLLDIGCGPLQGGVAIIGYLDRGRYAGTDRNARHLTAAYGQIKTHGLSDKNPRLIFADDFGGSELNGRRFDYIWASQILYYFNDEQMSGFFRFVAHHLNPGGKLLGDIIGDGHPEFRTPAQSHLLRQLTLHSIDSLARCAEPARLQVRNLGVIEQYGYPRRLVLRTNLLFEATPG